MTLHQNLSPGAAWEDFHGLPAWAYRSPELLDLEYARVILPSWQFACHESQVREPGSYATLELMRDSILVMRGQDGKLRAFKNVCRHRGAKLLDGAGRCKGPIVCPYHGWTYAHDGGLRSILAPRSFPGIDRGKLGLEEVELETFFGLVFVRVIPGGPSLAAMFGDLARHLTPFRIERMELVGEQVGTQQWDCNWKVGVDNNLENYHVPVGHPGYNRLLDIDPEDLASPHGVFGSITRLKSEPSPNRTERLYQRLAPEVLTDVDEQTRRTWLFFTMPPNIGIDVYADSMDVFQILPRTAETCTVRYAVYAPKDDRREARILRYLNSRINRQVTAEDKELCERVQQGLASHGYQPGPLSTLEVALKDFHDRITACIPGVRSPSRPADLERIGT